MSTMQTVIEKLAQEHNLPDGELLQLITSTEADTNQLLAAAADKIRQQYYGKKVYIRGLIEFTNYCKNNCYYCVLMIYMVIIASDKRIMGRYVNGHLWTAITWATIAVIIILTIVMFVLQGLGY